MTVIITMVKLVMIIAVITDKVTITLKMKLRHFGRVIKALEWSCLKNKTQI